MTTFSDPGAVAEWWRAAVLATLDACELSEPISTTYTASGVVVWDDCCGTLCAAPERVYRSATFPQEDVDVICETSELAVQLVVLLVRCVPVLGNDGRPPTAEAMSEAYGRINRDAALVWGRMAGQLPDGCSRANLSQTWVGAEGGCIAVETRMVMGLDQSSWCPDCTPPDDA